MVAATTPRYGVKAEHPTASQLPIEAKKQHAGQQKTGQPNAWLARFENSLTTTADAEPGSPAHSSL
jgi:hypothetical protein